MVSDKAARNKALYFSVDFRKKIAITFTLLIIFVMLISVYLVTHQIKQASLGRAEESGRLLGRMIALSMGEDIIRGNFQGIDYALKEFVKLNKINYCLILDNQGRIISSTHPNIHGQYFTDAWSRSALFTENLAIRRASNAGIPIYDTAVPIVIGGKRYGVIRAGFTIDEEFSHIRDLLFYNLSLGLILILIGVLIAYGISSTLLNPLNSILNAVESISQGDYSHKAFTDGSDEFAVLASSFNKLSNILQKREQTSNLITRKIVENDPGLASKNFSGKTLNAVILHLELSRFNAFIERNSPSEAVDTLNSFFRETAEIVAQADGVIDKFGEGFIVALFPISRNDSWPAHLRAGFAALSARNNLNFFNRKQAQLGLEELSLKSGLTAGKVIIGHLGTLARSDFSAIGSKISLARKIAYLSNKSNGYAPIADKSFANFSRDYLRFKPLHESQDHDNEDESNFILTGFAGTAYFRERLKSASARGNTSIISAFGMTESREGLEFLRSSIEDSQCEFRIEAIKALAPYVFVNDEQIVEYLKELIKNSDDDQIKSAAVSILGLCRDNRLAPFFKKLADSEDDRLRANAVEAIISLDMLNKKDFLKIHLNDEAPRACANALLGLWLSDDQETLTSLYDLLKSDNSKMRASGAFAVFFLARSRKFRKLFPAYSEQDNFLPLPIIENIYKRLKLMIDSIDTSERYQALRAIGRIGDGDASVIVSDMLKNETEPEIIDLGRDILKEWEKMIKPQE